MRWWRPVSRLSVAEAGPFQWGRRLLGPPTVGGPALSSAAPGRLQMHGPATGTFSLVEVGAADKAP